MKIRTKFHANDWLFLFFLIIKKNCAVPANFRFENVTTQNFV